MVKTIVDAHRGAVGVDENPEGGSVFWFPCRWNGYWILQMKTLLLMMIGIDDVIGFATPACWFHDGIAHDGDTALSRWESRYRI